MLRVAIIQYGPVYNHLSASLEKAAGLISQAALEGAKLVVFGETWFCGYPAWLDHCPDMGHWDNAGTKEVFALMHRNSVEVPGPTTEFLAKLAQQYQVSICTGINECVQKGAGNGSLFNSLLIINSAGNLILHHRKLMPTYTEKILYGLGDGRGTQPVALEGVQVGGLICWEHWMPLTRYVLHEAGEHIHIAVWPTVHEMHQVASRHYAFEGRCFVITAGQVMRVHELPSQLKTPEKWKDRPDEWVLSGGSAIIGPNGYYISPPVYNEEKIIYADIDPDDVYKERMTLDVTGHYQRSDLFNLDFYGE